METGQDDEITALKAIFCKEGELEARKDPDGQHVTICFQFPSATDTRLFNCGDSSATLWLPHDYPQKGLPVISLKCTLLPVTSLHTLTGKIQERANSLQGEAMLMDLFLYAQELLEEETQRYMNSKLVLADSAPSTLSKNSRKSPGHDCCVNVKVNNRTSIDKTNESIYDSQATITADANEFGMLRDTLQENAEQLSQTLRSQMSTCVLQLDHMRAKQSYTKLIKKWVLELGLTGRLCFCQKVILLVLQGESPAIKEYIVKNRTTNVDVDSKGRSCKERMLTVLCEVPCDMQATKFQDFAVLDLQTPTELQALFHKSSLEHIYKEYVIDQLGITNSKSTAQRH